MYVPSDGLVVIKLKSKCGFEAFFEGGIFFEDLFLCTILGSYT
jgi:hypothetical protein